MFYYVEGTVATHEMGLVVIDCAGVGYACHTSQHTIASVKVGKKAKLYTHLHIREDLMDLYGFADLEELRCFRMLIGVSGVGPKAALSILSVAKPSQLALSIITGEEKVLTQAPGIGKKIAQRIVLELQDKMKKEQLASEKESLALPAQTMQSGGGQLQEAIAALQVLGYSRMEAMQAMEGMDATTMQTEEMIRVCLKKLARN